MGQVLTIFAQERTTLPQIEFFLDQSLSILEEHFVMYRNISQAYAIDDSQFKDIFGQLHPVFDILDTSNSLLIQGLQLFTAMALFSKLISIEDKISFIFKIFDFNELNSLSCTDMQFLILTCCTVTHKLLGIRSRLQQDIIFDFVQEQFNSLQRISISQTITWGLNSEFVLKFVNIIYNESDTFLSKNKDMYKVKSLLSKKMYRSFQFCSRNDLGAVLSSTSKYIAYINTNQKQQKKWLMDNRKLIDTDTSAQSKLKLKQIIRPLDNSDIVLQPNWIYGIRYKDIKYFINFVNQNQLIYLIGKVVVLFNIKSQKQRHYLQHNQQVICLAQTSSHSVPLIATSELVALDILSQKLPMIRIWNPNTLQTVSLIQGDHKVGVHLMKFSNSGEFLITCGLSFYSPIIIYSVFNTFSPLFSVSSQHPTVQIAVVFGIVDKKSDDFVVATLYGLKSFTVTKKQQDKFQFQCRDLSNLQNSVPKVNQTYQYGTFSAITCCAYININQNLKYLSSYDESNQKLVVTGHEKGEVFVWSIAKNSILWQLNVDNAEITCIVPSIQSIIIGSNSSKVCFWDVDLKKKKKLFQVDVTTLDIKLNGYEVVTIVQRPCKKTSSLTNNYSQKQYVIGTSKGDFFLMGLHQKQDHSLRYKLIGPRYNSTKLSKIAAIGQINVHHVLQRINQNNIILFGGVEGVLYIVNASTKMITESWKIGQEIVAMDCIEFKEQVQIVVGTKNKRVYYSSNFIQKSEKTETQKQIRCLKMIIDNGHVLLIMGLQGGYLNFVTNQNEQVHKPMSKQTAGDVISNTKLAKQQNNSQLLKNTTIGNATTLKMQQYNSGNVVRVLKLISTVTQINSLQKKMLLASTQDNVFYIISLKDYHFKIIQPDVNPLSLYLIKNKCIKTYYCITEPKGKGLNKKLRLPAILNKNQKQTIISSSDGVINIWRNLTDSTQQNRLKYQWHASPCCNFVTDKEQTKLYSSGTHDGMVIQSSLLRFYQANRNIGEPSRTIISAASMQSLVNYNLNYDPKDGSDYMIQKQIQFCTFNNEITTQKYDQHILVRGLENETLCRLFKGMSEQWKTIGKDSKMNSSPRLSLKLDYVYGIQTDNKRSTVFTLNIPYAQFVYFVSNLVVVYDPTINTQKIYRGHRYKITCINKICVTNRLLGQLTRKKEEDERLVELVVSAESCQHPMIKIWNPHTLETVRNMPTVHTWGVINIFSNHQVVLSYGISNKFDKIYSLQLTQISTSKIRASRQFRQLIYSMAISPINSNQFVTTGRYNITIWRAVCANIQKYSVVQIRSIATCCLYRLVQKAEQESLKSKYVEEILIGCENGELGLLTQGCKYFAVDEKAHQKSINSICYINFRDVHVPLDQHSFQNSVFSLKNKNIKYIATCSEDETIRIWNKNFKVEFQQQICKIQFEERPVNMHNIYGNSQSFQSGATNSAKNSSGVQNNQGWSSNNQKGLSKNMSVQSISAVYEINNDNQVCLLLATRNGDVMIMKQSNKNNYENTRKPSSHRMQKRMSLDHRSDVNQINSNLNEGERSQIRKRSSSKGIKILGKRSIQQKSSFVSNTSKSKLRSHERSSIVQMSPFFKQNTESRKNSYVRDQEQDERQDSHSALESIKFILYLRSHSSQISTSTRPEYINQKDRGGKVLFSHHPRFQIIATIAHDQNLMFWDTQRNILILNRMLGYVAEPTALKFTKDGEILIIGYSDGRLLFLDSMISKSHQGKGDEKYVLPSLKILMDQKNQCPVLAIEQSESGDHLAVSYNNKSTRTPTSNLQNSQKSTQNTKQKSHICIFLNKSRDKMRGHGTSKMQHNALFQNVTIISCQSDSIYVTQNGNKYGMAAHSMMFTENQGKTYLLIYEQLIDVNTHNRLNYNKDGNYIIWDVNTSTMIANLQQVSMLNWKKISVPNSIHSRYQLFQSQSINEQFSQKQKTNVNSNLLIPYMSTMLNLPNHLILGSVNGDIHAVQSFCLQYENMIQGFPNKKQMFVGKTYPAHCSQINHMEFNQDKSILYSVGLSDKCVLKWKIDCDYSSSFISNFGYNQKNTTTNAAVHSLAINSSMHQTYNNKFRNNTQNNGNITNKQNQQAVQQQIDMFKQVPNLQQIQSMMQSYRIRKQRSYICNSILILEQQNKIVKNVVDFVETVSLVDVVGRRAHDIRYNLWYNCESKILYSSGHALTVLNLNRKQNQINSKMRNFNTNRDSIRDIKDRTVMKSRQFLNMMNGTGSEPSQQITCICVSEDRKLLYSGHNGIAASVSVWNINNKVRLKTIILNKIVSILMIRASGDNKMLVIYGINDVKSAFLMMVNLKLSQVLGIVNFVHDQPWYIKDIAFYPGSNHKFVTCGVNDTASWRLVGNQLTYGVLSSGTVVAESQLGNTNSNYGRSSYSAMNTNKSISLCVAFLLRSLRVVTGCEDGNLMFWGENSVQRREHTDMVMVLKVCAPNILLSGSRDGNILLWVEETSSTGLILCSRLNLKNQSATLLRPHGNGIFGNMVTDGDKKSKEQTSFLGNPNKNMEQSKYTNGNKAPQQESLELSIQSIDIVKLYGSNLSEIQDKESQIQNDEQRSKIPFKASERELSQVIRKNSTQVQQIVQKQMVIQHTFVPQKWQVLIGTTTGDIYQTTFSEQIKSKINFDESCQLLEVFHDQQAPKSFFFSKTDTEIYQINYKGYFTCRRIADSTVIYQYNFNKETVEMLYSAKSNIFIVVFKTQFRIFQTLDKSSVNQNYQLKPLLIHQTKFITHAEISPSQKILAVATIKNSDKSINIQVFQILKQDEVRSLLNLAMPTGESIQFLDFSLNNKMLLTKLVSGKIIAQELQSLQNVKQDLVQLIQWNNQAQNLFDRNKKMIKKVEQMFEVASEDPSESSIVRVSEVVDNIFVLVNDIGNVYAFNDQMQLVGQSRLKISDPSIVKFSNSKKLLGIGSEIDRNVVVFDIGLVHVLKGYQ